MSKHPKRKRVWLVQVKGWGECYVTFSIHRTKKGANANIKAANEYYVTTSAYIDEGILHG